jgi:hypothetical protein
MESALEFLLVTGGIILAALIAVFAVGYFVLWRSSRKLKETS